MNLLKKRLIFTPKNNREVEENTKTKNTKNYHEKTSN